MTALHRLLGRDLGRLLRRRGLMIAAETPRPEAPRKARPRRQADDAMDLSEGRKGWTPGKRRVAHKRFGEIMIQLAAEIDVPANELLTYVLKGDVPPEGRDEGFADTVLPSIDPRTVAPAALPPPAIVDAEFEVVSEPSPARDLPTGDRKYRHWTRERDEQLSELAGTMPVDDLAEVFGVTRNALVAHASKKKISLRRREGVHALDKAADARREEQAVAEREAAVHTENRESHADRIAELKAASERRLADLGGAPLPSGGAMRPRAPGIMISPGGRPASRDMFRLQHRDGIRWLSIDGLGWVTDKQVSFIATAAQIGTARKRLELARDCVAVPEPSWQPRDIAFEQILRESR